MINIGNGHEVEVSDDPRGTLGEQSRSLGPQLSSDRSKGNLGASRTQREADPPSVSNAPRPAEGRIALGLTLTGTVHRQMPPLSLSSVRPQHSESNASAYFSTSYHDTSNSSINASLGPSNSTQLRSTPAMQPAGQKERSKGQMSIRRRVNDKAIPKPNTGHSVSGNQASDPSPLHQKPQRAASSSPPDAIPKKLRKMGETTLEDLQPTTPELRRLGHHPSIYSTTAESSGHGLAASAPTPTPQSRSGVGIEAGLQPRRYSGTLQNPLSDQMDISNVNYHHPMQQSSNYGIADPQMSQSLPLQQDTDANLGQNSIPQGYHQFYQGEDPSVVSSGFGGQFQQAEAVDSTYGHSMFANQHQVTNTPPFESNIAYPVNQAYPYLHPAQTASTFYQPQGPTPIPMAHLYPFPREPPPPHPDLSNGY